MRVELGALDDAPDEAGHHDLVEDHGQSVNACEPAGLSSMLTGWPGVMSRPNQVAVRTAISKGWDVETDVCLIPPVCAFQRLLSSALKVP